MDHRYIAEHNIPETYVLGRLSDPESEAFEAHLIDCTKCLDRLAEAEVFCRAMKGAVVQPTSRSNTSLSPGLLAGIGRISYARPMALSVGLLLLAVILLGVIAVQFIENRRLNRELASANAAHSNSVPGPISQPDSSTAKVGGDSAHAAESPALPVQPPAVGGHKPVRSARKKSFGKLTYPQINVPMVAFSSSRGVEPGLSAPVIEIKVPGARELLIFSLELDVTPKYGAYRATIFTSEGRYFWRAEGLQPNRYDALILTFLSTFFPPRDYMIVLEGKDGNEGWVPAGNYSFRISK